VPRTHLTDLAIRSLKAERRETYWDENFPAFGIRVGKRSKTFLVMVGPRRRRITIGRYPHYSLQTAKRKAMALLSAPHADHVSMRYDDALEGYLTLHCAKNNKPRTARQTERLLRRHFGFGNAALSTISARRLMTIVDALPPGEANHAFVAARSFFNWCLGRQYIDRHPLIGLKLPYRTQSRTRVLTPEELRSVWMETTTSDKPSYKAIQLLILTGQRCNEIASLEWAFINEAERVITLPPALTKNNSEHTFPYGELVMNVLAAIPRRSRLVFPSVNDEPMRSWGTIKRHFDAIVRLPHWTLHDLRRTYSTMNAQLGTPPHVTEALLNHKTGSRSPIQRIYDRHTYLPEMRAAVARYEAHLAQLCAAV
jgi:integrase